MPWIDTLKTRWQQVQHWWVPAGWEPMTPIDAMLPNDIRRVVDCR